MLAGWLVTDFLATQKTQIGRSRICTAHPTRGVFRARWFFRTRLWIVRMLNPITEGADADCRKGGLASATAHLEELEGVLTGRAFLLLALRNAVKRLIH